MKHLTTALLCTFALGLAACGGDDDDRGSSANTGSTGTTASESAPENKYPEAVRKTFLDSCDAQPNASRSVCQCALDRVEKTVSYEDFKEADAAIREDAAAKPPAYDKLVKAARECARAAN